MEQIQLPIPEIGIIAATRGMLGAGTGLLLAEKLPKDKRIVVGWTLLLIGAVSTLPLVLDLVKNRKHFARQVPVNKVA